MKLYNLSKIRFFFKGICVSATIVIVSIGYQPVTDTNLQNILVCVYMENEDISHIEVQSVDLVDYHFMMNFILKNGSFSTCNGNRFCAFGSSKNNLNLIVRRDVFIKCFGF